MDDHRHTCFHDLTLELTSCTFHCRLHDVEEHKFVFTTFRTLWRWIMANFSRDDYSQATPLMDMHNPPRTLATLPNLICMPHTSRSALQIEGVSVQHLKLVMNRVTARGVHMLPDWEEGLYFLQKTSLYQQLKDVFPLTANGGLPDVCVLPSAPVQLDAEISVAAIQQVRRFYR
jgi:hypothetical protein